MRGLASVYGRGVDAAEEVLRKVYGVEIRKALNPLDDAEFVAVVRRVSNALQDAARPEERAAAARAADRLTRDWEKMTADQQAEAIRAAGDEIRGAPPKFMPAVDVVIKAGVEEMVPETRKQMVAVHKLRIKATTTARDDRTIKTVREVESFFVRDQYGRLADDLSQRARDVVARGLLDGVGSKEISSQLQGVMAKAERPPSYWDVVAMTFSNRARVFTQVHSLDDAGFKEFVFDAVLDQATTNICRYLHGKRFSVNGATKRIAKVRADDPEGIVTTLPWVSEGRTSDGKRAMFYEDAEGKKHLVATIEQSAVGQIDAVGTFGKGMQEGRLERAGLTTPPLHGRCRSTIRPA